MSDISDEVPVAGCKIRNSVRPILYSHYIFWKRSVKYGRDYKGYRKAWTRVWDELIILASENLNEH